LKPKYSTLSAAIQKIPSGARVFVQGGAATPNALLGELVAQAPRLRDVTLIHLHTEGPALYGDPRYQDTFRVINFFVGANLRRRMDYNRIDYLPCFLSEIPALFRSGACPLDIALLHVSPPDRFGFCSLGVSVDVARAAAEMAPICIAQVNPNMPRLHGDGLIPIQAFDALVEVEDPLPEVHFPTPSAREKDIARHVSSLIEDGATLQMGIGTIPNAVLNELTGHRDLGLHTEMWSDGALQLIERGIITNARKKVHRGKSVSGFLFGTKRLYDFVDDNPSVLQLEIDYVNQPNNIARNPKVVAINSAVEIDLTGQVCADSIGHNIISGVGGQMDFMRGAALSKGGKPIIALNSTTASGQSKIVGALQSGAGVVTTRAHVHYVVTEYGIASLYGKTLRERAEAMIAIAHPNHREALTRAFYAQHP
jgi:4-hydroxybutyrate CoA-transferase